MILAACNRNCLALPLGVPALRSRRYKRQRCAYGLLFALCAIMFGAATTEAAPCNFLPSVSSPAFLPAQATHHSLNFVTQSFRGSNKNRLGSPLAPNSGGQEKLPFSGSPDFPALQNWGESIFVRGSKSRDTIYDAPTLPIA